ncbi:MAG: hypothetical protein ACD_77C00002G0003 [uncultured bacterium]|nr:MAG: hypothetical protein ACD_77C00002G0003 [uncultured bacterium]
MVIPRYLFRGDSDQENERQLKSTFNSGLLLTNLINGGSGREIFSSSLGQLVNKHIATVWDRTHFLSFTSDERTAFFYGSNDKAFEDVYDDKEIWDFSVLTFDTLQLIQESVNEIETGIYSAQFHPTYKEFMPTYKVILIDALSHLKSIAAKTNTELTTIIAKADKDKEWLILPANPFGYNGEFTAKLDTHCITDKRVFRYI